MKVIIKQNSSEPAYLQVYRQIKEQILNDEIKEGDLLPSIRALAKSIRTSVITVKRAYQDLQDEGYIYTVVGKGSFVNKIDKVEILENQKNEIRKNLRATIKQALDLGFSLEELENILKEINDECG